MPEEGSVRRSSSVAQPVLAIYAFVGGLLSFVAYAADLPRLADWLNSGIAIQPNTAIAVIAAAFAVMLMWGGYVRAAGILGVLVAAIGGTVIFEYRAASISASTDSSCSAAPGDAAAPSCPGAWAHPARCRGRCSGCRS